MIIAANPTTGLDVGATDFVQRKLLAARDSGAAIVLVSIDLDELLQLSDRIICLYRGTIAYHAPRSEIAVDELAYAMAGSKVTTE